jgi:hypothetical protein
LAQPTRHELPTNEPVFKDGSEAAGVDFRHFNGGTGSYYLPEITGSGVAVFDMDNDGDLEIYFVQGSFLRTDGQPQKSGAKPLDQLYRNDSANEINGQKTVRFTNVTEPSGISASGYGMGVTAADINNDGWKDLYVSNFGANQLFVNSQDGTFTDMALDAGVSDDRWSTSSAFLDYDRDGWLDLYVASYVDFTVKGKKQCYTMSSATDYCGPDAYNPLPDRLFRNKGDGTFEDVSLPAGINGLKGAGLGVVALDANSDGWIDIYVANDGDPNFLWINQKDGSFVDEALLSGVALNRSGKPEAGMGVDAGDFDSDGDEDLFVTHLMGETNTLYVNLGDSFFEDNTIEAGLHSASFNTTSFGTSWLDFDNDGRLDLLTLSGAVRIIEELARSGDPFPLSQKNQLFHNSGNGVFREVSATAGAAFQIPEVSRGAATGDIDNDGDIDVVILNNSGPARLLLNQSHPGHAWINIRLIGPTGRDMLGALATLIFPDGTRISRRVRNDGSYCSSRDPRILFGCGSQTLDPSLEVLWPNGETEKWSKLPLKSFWTLRQGTAPAKERQQ